ncbi:hypothetical protein N0B44_10775 [Roseibacterium beibuensis]|uniref:Aspartate carbamoyltransferase catalytic subunit n=1 Tax=[Roseibacterium] beibuensis TaxID=1193142 RepID=A0ABP9LLS8_9RHOB|nr:hypothetical protein [Roseibacterium beibuensis]MCS6623398.1 hypothetical protein [Roseibacterium beibuensis]
MSEQLRIYALNVDSKARHTNLTRARGEISEMPPLTDWLGVEVLDHREIELFPIEDLGDMRLSDYIRSAFDPAEAIRAETALRLDALSGSVLILPGRALEEEPDPGSELTEIAVMEIAVPDHEASLPKADLTSAAPTPQAEDLGPEKTRRWAIVFLLTALVLAGLVLLIGALG